jgi:hypothetical protein
MVTTVTFEELYILNNKGKVCIQKSAQINSKNHQEESASLDSRLSMKKKARKSPPSLIGFIILSHHRIPLLEPSIHPYPLSFLLQGKQSFYPELPPFIISELAVPQLF